MAATHTSSLLRSHPKTSTSSSYHSTHSVSDDDENKKVSDSVGMPMLQALHDVLDQQADNNVEEEATANTARHRNYDADPIVAIETYASSKVKNVDDDAPSVAESVGNTMSRSAKHLTGIGLTLASSICSTINTVLSQILLTRGGISILQLTCFRQIVPFICLCLWFVWLRYNSVKLRFVKNHGAALTGRGIFAIIGSGALAYALTKLPVGDVSSLVSTSPVFVAILAHFLLPREQYKFIYFVTTLFLLAGCVLIARPSMLFGTTASTTQLIEANRLIGVGAALLVAVCAAITMIATRVERHVAPTVSLFYISVVGIVLTFGFAIIFSLPLVPTTTTTTGSNNLPTWEIIILALICVSASAGFQLLLACAAKYEDANIVSLVRTADVLWSFCAQMLVFGVIPQLLTVIGAALIIGSVLFLGIQFLVSTKTQSNKKEMTELQEPHE